MDGLWNGPLCDKCHGTTWEPVDEKTARKCTKCHGTGRGEIRSNIVYAKKTPDHTSPIGSR